MPFPFVSSAFANWDPLELTRDMKRVMINWDCISMEAHQTMTILLYNRGWWPLPVGGQYFMILGIDNTPDCIVALFLYNIWLLTQHQCPCAVEGLLPKNPAPSTNTTWWPLGIDMNDTSIVVESSDCYHLVKLRLDRAVKSMQDIFCLKLDPGENLGWCIQLDHHLKALGSMGLQLFKQPF